MKYSIIIPVFNEEETLEKLLKKVCKQKENFNLEIIIINDGSTDSTKEIIAKNKNLVDHSIDLETNIGKGGAVKEGLKFVSGDYVLFQDADLEYDPSDFGKIFYAIEKFEAEVVIGSRFLSPQYTRVYNYFHKKGNLFITGLFNLLFNTTFTDIYSCYMCFKSDLFDFEILKTKGWEQHAEILAESIKNSSVYYEVPISYSGRTFEEGKKIRGRHVFKVIFTIIKKKLF